MSHTGFVPTMEPAQSLTTAEQALRDVVAAVMYQEHGAGWLEVVVPQDVLERWQAVRAEEERQRAGHILTGVSDLSYAFLGDLVELIKKKGHWSRLFEPIFGDKASTFALLDLLQRIRRPVDHARPLLPFEEDLASGIAGYLRNRVTIYLSNQDPIGDYYSRIERIEDSFGNAFTHQPGADPDVMGVVNTTTTLRVGDQVTFRCHGTDPEGRALNWRLAAGGQVTERQVGNEVDLVWTVSETETGNPHAQIWMNHDGRYHRNINANTGTDGLVLFRYRVLPPQG